MKAALAAVLVGAAVVAVVVVAGLGGFSRGPRAAAPSTALAVRTSLTPRTIAFGDPAVAEVSVAFDPRAVASTSVRVDPSFGAFVQTAAPDETRTRAGDTATIVYRFPLQCVTDGCVPHGRSRTVTFPPVIVTATAGAKRLVSTGRWPSLVVASRLGQKDVAATVPTFRRSTLPPVAYGASPLLADLLTAAAGVLAATAAVLAALELAAFARRRRGTRVQRTPLALAAAYVRQAAARPDPADRRKALALLAETLAGEGEPTRAAAAGDVAWAEEAPTADRTLAALHDAVPEAQ